MLSMEKTHSKLLTPMAKNQSQITLNLNLHKTIKIQAHSLAKVTHSPNGKLKVETK